MEDLPSVSRMSLFVSISSVACDTGLSTVTIPQSQLQYQTRSVKSCVTPNLSTCPHLATILSSNRIHRRPPHTSTPPAVAPETSSRRPPRNLSAPLPQYRAPPSGISSPAPSSPAAAEPATRTTARNTPSSRSTKNSRGRCGNNRPWHLCTTSDEAVRATWSMPTRRRRW